MKKTIPVLLFLLVLAQPVLSETSGTTFAVGGSTNVAIPIIVDSADTDLYRLEFKFVIEPASSVAAGNLFDLTIPAGCLGECTDDIDSSGSDTWEWSSITAGTPTIDISLTGGLYSVYLYNDTALCAGDWSLHVNLGSIDSLVYVPDGAANALKGKDGSGVLLDPPCTTAFGDPGADTVIMEPLTGTDLIAVPEINTDLCVRYHSAAGVPALTFTWDGPAPDGTAVSVGAAALCDDVFQITPSAAADGYTGTLTVQAFYNFTHPLTVSRAVQVLVDHLPEVPEPPSDLRIMIGNSVERYLYIEAISQYGGSLTLNMDQAGDLEFDSDNDHGYFTATLENSDTFVEDDFENPVITFPGITNSEGTYLHMRYIPFEPGATNKTLELEYEVAGQTATIPVALSGSEEAAAARIPQDIAVVLDRSGSMSGPTHCPDDVGTPVTKVVALRAAAGLFYRIFEAVAAANSDRLSVVEYNQDAVTPIAIGPAAVNAPVADALLPGFTPGGMTSISRALVTGLNSIDLPDPADSSNRAILLMTDGRHNTPGGITFQSDFNGGAFEIGKATPDQTHLYVVGLGNGGNLNASLLTDLAQGSLSDMDNDFLPGGYRHTCEEEKLAIYFAQILAKNFTDLGIVADDAGSVLPGEESVQEMPVNSSADTLIFYLTWLTPGSELSFRLVAPDGTEISTDSQVRDTFYTLQVVDLPLNYDGRKIRGGLWKMIVSTAGGGGETAIPFEAALMAQDSVISSDFSIEENGDHVTGDPVILTATLQEGGRPLLEADVYVKARIPTAGLGNFIFTNEIDTDTVVTGDAVGDSPETLKLESLLEQIPEGLESVLITLPLIDNGAAPDEAAGDGIYTLQLQRGEEIATRENGIYTYVFQAAGTTELGESFRRTEAVSEYLPSEVSDEQSDVTCNVFNPNTAVVSVTLRDRFGNFIDPVTGRTMTVSPAAPNTVEFKVERRPRKLDGTYQFTLHAGSGHFNRFMDFSRLIRFKSGGVGRDLILPVQPFWYRLGIEAFGGYSFVPSTLPVAPAALFGVRLLAQPLYLLRIEPELGIHLTDDNSGKSGYMIQYGLMGRYIVPVDLQVLTVELEAGIGGMSFIDFTNINETNFSILIGAGFSRALDAERRVELEARARDCILVESYGNSFVHLLQISAALKYRF